MEGNGLELCFFIFSTGVRLLSSTYQRQILTDEQVEAYQRDSYVVLHDLLTPDEKKDFQRIATEIENWPVSDEWFSYYEKVDGVKRLSRLEGFYENHADLKKYVEGKLGQAASDLIGEEAVLFKEKLNMKYPGGFGYDPHQDGVGSWNYFGQFFHMSAVVTADPMTVENGCLQLVAGDWGELPWLPMDENGDITDEVARGLKWNHVICDAGSVIMFNSHVPHKSDVNHTDQSRRAFFITWNGKSLGDTRQKYYDLRRECHPPDHLRDPNKDYTELIRIFNEHNLEQSNNRWPNSPE